MGNQVNRVEVIDEDGRKFTRINIDKVEAVLQDDGETLKVFLNRDWTDEEGNESNTDIILDKECLCA